MNQWVVARDRGFDCQHPLRFIATTLAKQMPRVLIAVAMLLSATLAQALNATSKPGIDLTGHWSINHALSDDAEALLAQRQEEEMQQRRRWEERRRAQTPLEELDEQMTAPPPNDPRYGRERRTVREAQLRRMLGVTKVLDITQPAAGATLEIRSDAEARKFQSGLRSQVSMPEGELADSNVGWDGEWFVIDRRVRNGPRVLERYRRLRKTDQLESIIAWSGDTQLAGIKVRRIFDRTVGTAPPPDPASGPIR